MVKGAPFQREGDALSNAANFFARPWIRRSRASSGNGVPKHPQPMRNEFAQVHRRPSVVNGASVEKVSCALASEMRAGTDSGRR